VERLGFSQILAYRMLTVINTGNMESVFMDSFERCLKIAADYGGAIKIHALFGVRDMHP